MDPASRRVGVLSNHLREAPPPPPSLQRIACLQYSPPELSETVAFDVGEMRKLMDGHNLADRDWLFGLISQSNLFNMRKSGGRVFVSPDYNQSMEQQREMTMRRIGYLRENGVFDGWLTGKGVEVEMRKMALVEVISIYDHSLSIKLGVHFFLWGGAIQFFGTKRHHDKWLRCWDFSRIRPDSCGYNTTCWVPVALIPLVGIFPIPPTRLNRLTTSLVYPK